MSENSFPRAGFFTRGYDPSQVDEFFAKARKAYEGGVPAEKFSAAQVRGAHFDLVRRGYQTSAIDQAMDRLEAAFVRRDRADNVAVNGSQAWMERVAQRATTLYPRMLRPRGKRFAHPDGKGYDAAQVDELLDRLAEYFDSDEGMTSAEIRNATFKTAKNEKSYKEGVVDAYLSRAIEVLLAVE